MKFMIMCGKSYWSGSGWTDDPDQANSMDEVPSAWGLPFAHDESDTSEAEYPVVVCVVMGDSSSPPCPFGGECKGDGHPCDRDQHGQRIEQCERNLERGLERYIQLSDVLETLRKPGLAPYASLELVVQHLERELGGGS